MARPTLDRSQLLLGCGSAAIALALISTPEKVEAQAINASENVVRGSAFRSFPEIGREVISVETPTVVIDWTPPPSQGPTPDFLPTGNEVTFRNSTDFADLDFAVLNRILPSLNGDVAVIDGTVISRIFDGTGTARAGGTVAFYSPTGILVGNNAIFDVGNLILTTLDPNLDSFEDFAINGGQLQLGDGQSTPALIRVETGAQINATAENSYLALVSAEIAMLGTSNINGSQAFIGGEVVNLTVSNGLFDIQIPVGSRSSLPILMDGNVGGPSSTGAGDNHVIYAVAAAQADPISMIFSGNLGFEPAASAGIVNGEIILSANYDVNGRNVDGATISDGIAAVFDGNSETSDAAGRIFVENFTASSSLLAIANEEAVVGARGSASSVDGDLLIVGRRFAEMSATEGLAFDVTGDVLVSARDFGEFGAELLDGENNATGGDARIETFPGEVSNGGNITIGGDALVTADAFAGQEVIGNIAGSATGGSASIAVRSGAISILGNAAVQAGAFGAPNQTQSLGGDLRGGDANVISQGNGTLGFGGTLDISTAALGTNAVGTASDTFGGFAALELDAGGSLVVAGDVVIDVSAIAGASNTSGFGALADAGNASLFIAGLETMDLQGDVLLDATAFGGRNASGPGGTGLGGVALGFVPNEGTLSIGGDYTALARALGGRGIGGGDGLGGIAGLQVITGAIDVAGAALVDAQGIGVTSMSPSGSGGDGGDGIGGSAFLRADGSVGAIGRLTIGSDAEANADGFGGIGGVPDISIPAGAGGLGTGGQSGTGNQANQDFENGASILAGNVNGTVSVGGTATARAIGRGGRGGTGFDLEPSGPGGDGIGGTARVGLIDFTGSASFASGEMNLADVVVRAVGIGGNAGGGGPSGEAPGDAGDGFGGDAVLLAQGGFLTASIVNLDATGIGPAGDLGGSGFGGLAAVQGSAGAIAAMDRLEVFAQGESGNGDTGSGSAVGGAIDVLFENFDLTVLNDVLLDARARGGIVDFGNGNTARGGFVTIGMFFGVNAFTIGGNLELDGTAVAGAGASLDPAASAIGGDTSIGILGSSVLTVDGVVEQRADAFGAANADFGRGGDGIGGISTLFIDGGGVFDIGGDYRISASASGGEGSGGGDGFGGIATAEVFSGTLNIAGNAAANANGRGGNGSVSLGLGGVGGTGIGGRAIIAAEGGLAGEGVVSIGNNALVTSNGTGGQGGSGNGDDFSPGRGGDGIGGSADTFIAITEEDTGIAALIAGDNGSLSVGATASVEAIGTGGLGGQGGPGQSGARGGDGIGGTALAGIRIFEGNQASPLGNGSVAFGSLIANADGTGGAGGFGGSTQDARGDGGDGTAREAILSIVTGEIIGGSVAITANGTGGDGTNGGIGTGGSLAGLSIRLGGTATIDSISAEALGIGGDGLSGLGGAGVGGIAYLRPQDGIVLVNGDAIIDASGFGGLSGNGAGADGTGGTADISVTDPAVDEVTITGNAAIIANGFGGDALAGFTGGTGTGGEAFLSAQAGGSIDLGSALVSASGQGGSGEDADGGEGLGGLAYIEALGAGSTIDIQTATQFAPENSVIVNGTVVAAGIGGLATGGEGIGGAGTGGTVSLSATDSGAITLADDAADTYRILARGIGGNSVVDGGAGGSGTGGTALFQADEGEIVTGGTTFSVLGQGGSSGDETSNIAGGEGFGGSREITVANGGAITGTFSGGSSGAFGGSGSGSGNGGDATGGSTLVSVTDGSLDLIGASAFIDFSIGGAGAIGGNATGGTIDFQATNAAIRFVENADDVASALIGGTVTGGAGVDQGGIAQGSAVSVAVLNSTVTGAGSLIIAADAVGGDSESGTGGDALAGSAALLINPSTVELGGENIVSADAFGGAGAIGGNALAGNVDVEFIGSDVTISQDADGASSLLLSSFARGGGSTDQVGDASSGSALLTVFDSTLITNNLAIESDADASSSDTASGGTAIGGLAAAVVQGFSLIEADTFSITSDAVSSADGTAEGRLSRLFVDENASDTSGDDPLVNLAIGMLELRSDAAGGNTNIAGRFEVEIASGDILAATLSGSATGDTIAEESLPSALIASGGDLLVSDVLSIDVTDDFVLRTTSGNLIGSSNPADPTTDVTVRSAGTIVISGDDDAAIGVSGGQLTLESSDIEINSGALVSAPIVTVNSINGDAPGFLGGDSAAVNEDSSLGYVLSQEEIDRIDTSDFTFAQAALIERAEDGSDLIIGDATFSGSDGNRFSNVAINVAGPSGVIRVEGSLLLADVDIEDTLSLAAPGRIEVRTPGGISVLDSDGLPTGSLSLSSNDVWIADSELIEQLLIDPNFDGRDDLLSGAAAGSDDPFGFIQGGSVDLSVGTSLLVRNTGTNGDLRGILVGNGGLSISQSDPSATEGLDVFAYGARLTDTGDLVTGETFFLEVNYNFEGDRLTSYREDAELNDCDINTGVCGDLPPEVPGIGIPINNRTIIEGPVSVLPPLEVGQTVRNASFGMDFPELLRPPLIDEDAVLRDPVASGGDASFYGDDDEENSDDEE